MDNVAAHCTRDRRECLDLGTEPSLLPSLNKAIEREREIIHEQNGFDRAKVEASWKTVNA